MASEQVQPLQIMLPELYHFLTEKLEQLHNIHPYDIQVNGMKTDSGYELVIYFGDEYRHSESKTFSDKSIQGIDHSIESFIENVGDKCKEVMIADYFKMMKM